MCHREAHVGLYVFLFVFVLCVQVFTVKGRNEAANGAFAQDTAEEPIYLAAADWSAVSLSAPRRVYGIRTLPDVRRYM